MSVASQESHAGFALLDHRTRPGAHARYSENSTRALIPQTLLQMKRLLVRWSRDLPTVILTLVVPILFLVTLNTGSGRPDLDDYRAQRAVRQRSDGCRRRSDHRIVGRRYWPHARARRRVACPTMGPACAPCIGYAFAPCCRGRSGSGHHRGDPLCRTVAGFPIPTRVARRAGVADGAGNLRSGIRDRRHNRRLLFRDERCTAGDDAC